jgi:hypothetical protein
LAGIAASSVVPHPCPLTFVVNDIMPRRAAPVSGETHDRGLIDTNVVVHLAALDASHLPGEMVISLSAGPHHADDPAERARRMSVLQHAEATFDPLPFDAVAARAFGLVSPQYSRLGASPAAGSRT